MRTLIDIPEASLKRLNELSRTQKVSRAHLVRCAISDYLKKENPNALDAAFGMWADRGVDGLAYQEQMRREWERES